MSTRRLGPGPAIRPTNTRNTPRKLGGYKERSESSDSMPEARDSAREASDPRSKPMSRIPLNYGARRPSNPSQPTRPGIRHQGQSWGSTGSTSARSGSLGGSSGSSSSSLEPKLRPGLSTRRKGSDLEQTPESFRNHSRTDSRRTSSTSSIPSKPRLSERPKGIHYDRSLTQSPAEIRVAKAVDIAKPTTPTVTIYPELDRYRDIQRPTGVSGPEQPHKLTTHDLPPPTPGYFSGTGSQLSTMSGSPSTRFSESPGTGPYSRDTTPTSMSSQSPGLVVPVRFAPPGLQHGSPGRSRPPVTRRRGSSLSNGTDIFNADAEGLAAVRESLTSSSSNSTVRGADRNVQKKAQAPPMSPPPRKSSARQAEKARIPEPTTRKLTRRPTHPAVASPPPAMYNSGRQTSTASPRGTPPTRPSRQNTPDMHSQLWEPVPVVHSNLSSTSLPAERRGSESLTRRSSISRSTTPSGQPDRARPTNTRRPSGQDKASVRREGSGKEIAATKKDKTEPTRPTRTPSPSVTTSFNSRFPFFGRKKSAPTTESTSTTAQDKQTRRGPAAGTGHEGYGRLGAIRRRSSVVFNAARGSVGLTSPQDNPGNMPQFTDPFLRERMNPVVISGGEVIENRNTSDTEPDQTANSKGFKPTHSRQRSNDSRTSSKSASSREEDRKTLWPSAFPKTQRPSSRNRRPSESSDDGAVKSNLAYRRSAQRLRTSPDQGPMRLPKPINTKGTAPSPLTSFETNTTVDDFNPILQREISHNNQPKLAQPKKLTKRSRSPRKWNLFSRSQPQAKTSTPKVDEVAATVTVVQSRQVPFYEMMDSSEQEDGGDIDVMDVLRSAEVYDVPTPGTQEPALERKSPAEATSATSSELPLRADTDLLFIHPPLEVPSAKPEIPAPSLPQPSARKQTIPQPGNTSRPVKQSRLPQVGRIPKVVSTRRQEPSPRSFSRPFNKSSPQIPTTTIDQPSLTATTISPNLPKLPTPELTLHSSSATGESQEPSASASSALVGEGREFLAFSPRKDSTTTTSSSRCSGLYTVADTTAVIPSPSAPLAEDEIWDEYNDLLGDMTLKLPSSVPKRKALPPPPVRTGKAKARAVNENLESPTIATKGPQIRVDKGKIPEARKEVVSSVYSCDDDDDMELLRPSFAPTSPATPFSVSKFVAGYGERNNSGELSKVSAEDSQRISERNSGGSHKSRASSNSTGSKSSEDDSPLAQVNLRVGSMTVSKWLTFGHVLFSPAREELALSKGSRESHSVLVIDGLGNDDWSFYAAETYPGATFFNLSPRAPLPGDRRSTTALPLSPPNHYQIQHTDHLAKFPFGPDTFSTVVFRFPAAAPESHYRNIVSEARRVLKPGGYMELAILDVDLHNMGNRGRRTIRKLKERIHAKNPETNLASTADVMLRLLGRKKFVDIKSCRVGVPVASSLARGLGVGAKDAKGKGKEQRSLAEMMNDDSELADENIAKMVSRVARWWYARCYEGVAAPSGSKKGIWDRALLGECEEWGTSLKLMVCHARVPDGGNRVASI